MKSYLMLENARNRAFKNALTKIGVNIPVKLLLKYFNNFPDKFFLEIKVKAKYVISLTCAKCTYFSGEMKSAVTWVLSQLFKTFAKLIPVS